MTKINNNNGAALKPQWEAVPKDYHFISSIQTMKTTIFFTIVKITFFSDKNLFQSKLEHQKSVKKSFRKLRLLLLKSFHNTILIFLLRILMHKEIHAITNGSSSLINDIGIYYENLEYFVIT